VTLLTRATTCSVDGHDLFVPSKQKYDDLGTATIGALREVMSTPVENFMGGIKDKVIVITGASSGIGEAK
jgi:hypothetical protein